MLEEFVYLTEKGTPVGRDFGKFGDDKLGRLLNRLLSAYRRDRMYKDSMSVQREKVVMDAKCQLEMYQSIFGKFVTSPKYEEYTVIVDAIFIF